MIGARVCAATVAGVLLLVGAAAAPAPGLAARGHAAHRRRASTARAPSGPPLAGPGAVPREEAEQTIGIQSAAGDQLVENGLSSPLCKGAAAASLSSAARSDCASSDFTGAAAPSGDYGLDVHIDTGFGLSKGMLLSVIQDLLIAPAWGALQWLVYALVVMLEWCYTLELPGPGTSTVAHALLQARAGFTEPWLAFVLALASVLALYHGLVRRRVADTLGGALTMLAMMVGGLWVIADPAGTVGAVGAWADQASLGTLATTASGSPAGGAGALAEGMRALYVAAIETPWCYLEFGNVRWCSDPSRLDPGLRAAALALAGGGKGGAAAPTAHAAELVRGATSNGALFLAFPANRPQRNSINERGSLLSAICRGKKATECSGSAAPEAEFRTDGGTFPRLLGLLAIAAGVLGMALLFGLLALRLLAAAVVGLFLLLLAPLAVLAPAFGDGGRALFASWLTRLLAAVTSKLLFSFALGALLTMQRLLSALDTLGWWTQWLLVSGFWWTLFVKRHEIAAMVRGAARQRGPSRGGEQSAARPLPLLRRAEGALQLYGAVRHPVRWAEAQVNARIAQRPPREERSVAGGRRRQKADADSGDRRASASEVTHDPPRSASGHPPASEQVREVAGAAEAHANRVSADRAGHRPVAEQGISQSPQGRRPPPSSAASDERREAGAVTNRTAPSSVEGTVPPPAPRLAREEPSPVMEDAFAVARGRKRKLGYDSEQ